MQSAHELVASALSLALSASPLDRRQGEEVLLASSQQPGHCARLLMCAIAEGSLDDSVRLLAATQLRGQVQRRWRGGGHGIPAEERPALKAMLVEQLRREEPSDSVALQLSLAIARVMRAEANVGEADVLQSFVHALRAQPQPPQALLALLHTAKELSTMRLPSQRALAARVAMGLLPEVEPAWAASLTAIAAAGASANPRALRGAALHTKVVRQLIDRLGDGGGDIMALFPRGPALCAIALDGVEAIHRLHSTAPEWDRLGSALGKLVGTLAQVLGNAEAFPWVRTLAVCEQCLLDEAQLRRSLSASAETAEGLQALERRQQHGSSLAARCAMLFADGVYHRAAGGSPLHSLVPALITLMQRSIEQLREWSAEPEALACTELLPPLSDEEGDDDDDDGFDCEDDYQDGSLDAEQDEDDGNMESGDGDGAAALNGYGRAARLQHAAENALVAILDASPSEASAALLAQLPNAACAAEEPLGAQLQRDAAYGALGLSPYHLQDVLNYTTVLAAVTGEVEAIGAAAAAGKSLALAAPLQARLCWLLPCWWAFGAGEDDENERACAATYALLVGALHSGADLAVALQAARSLGLVIDGLSDDDLRVFAPYASNAISALAHALNACNNDESVRWCLRLLNQLLRQLPVAWPQDGGGIMPQALSELWARAEGEKRDLILRDLRRIAVRCKNAGVAVGSSKTPAVSTR